MLTSSLKECLDLIYSSYMEYGRTKIPESATLKFHQAEYYDLFDNTDRQITPTAALIFDHHRHPTQKFKQALRHAALIHKPLQDLTLRYLSGIADPSIGHMMKYLSTHYKDQYTESQQRKLIVICIDNFRFAYGLGVKLVEIK